MLVFSGLAGFCFATPNANPKRLYEYARAGEEVELPTKQIQIKLNDVQKLVIDGEVLDAQTVTVSVNPQALQVVAPIPLKF